MQFVNREIPPVEIQLMYGKRKPIKSVLHRGILFQYNMALWLRQLNLVQDRKQRLACTRERAYIAQCGNKQIDKFE